MAVMRALLRSMFPSMVPYVLIAAAIILVGGVAYGSGGDAWIAYATGAAGTFVALAGYIRWEARHYSA